MKRSTLAIVLSVVVLAAVLVAVLVFGVIPYPDYPSLADQPDPSIPGTIAFLVGDDPPCAMTMPASGGPATQIGCGWEMGGDGLAWASDGLLVTLDFMGSTPQYVLIDPATGDIVERIDADVDSPKPLFERRDATLVIDSLDKGAVLRVRDPAGGTRVLLEIDGPRDYRFETAVWSPDGNWVLASDSLDRLLVVRATGDPNPRILVEDVQPWNPAAWYIQGYDGYDIPGR